jgi:hypothetical protein
VCVASLFGCSNSFALLPAENIPMDDGDTAPLSVLRRIPIRVRVACVVQSKELAATEACHMVMTASISANRTARLGENTGQYTDGEA